jgi:methylglyoxal synthase
MFRVTPMVALPHDEDALLHLADVQEALVVAALIEEADVTHLTDAIEAAIDVALEEADPDRVLDRALDLLESNLSA